MNLRFCLMCYKLFDFTNNFLIYELNIMKKKKKNRYIIECIEFLEFVEL